MMERKHFHAGKWALLKWRTFIHNGNANAKNGECTALENALPRVLRLVSLIWLGKVNYTLVLSCFLFSPGQWGLIISKHERPLSCCTNPEGAAGCCRLCHSCTLLVFHFPLKGRSALRTRREQAPSSAPRTKNKILDFHSKTQIFL